MREESVDPMDGAVDSEGRPWCRGDTVRLVGTWPGLAPGDSGVVAMAVPRWESTGSILLVEWGQGLRRAGVPDDLVARNDP